MTLEFSNSINHSCGNKAKKQYSEGELKEILLNLMSKNGIDTNEVQTGEDSKLVVSGSPKLNLHTIMLEAEKLGLQTKYTKRTQIELFC